MSAPEQVRLHISPLTPESYSIVVPASLHDAVSAVSYHAIPTFPERNYGYVELPVADAERLKKRLNGALVKGAKIKIDVARPKRVVEYADESATPVPPIDFGRLQANPDKSSEGVLRGFRLPDSRRVRRAWTEPAMAKKVARKDKGGAAEPVKKSKAEKSKYTDKEELLFKTKLKTDAGKDTGKKRKRDDGTTIVHEFKQTTKFPNFLRARDGEKSKSMTEYDPEKGWVDEQGEVVEGPRRSRRKVSDAASKPGTTPKKSATAEVTKAAKKLSIQTKTSKSAPAPVEVDDEGEDQTSSSGSSGTEDDEEEEEDEEEGASEPKTQLTRETAPSDVDSTQPGEVEEEESEAQPQLTVETTPKPERSIPSLHIQPVSAASEKADEVHPLEALFKKPKGGSKKPPGLELKIPQPEVFSFFGRADDDESEDGDVPTALPMLPQTPFTQADMRFRRERSAAPTPDTAAPTKLLFGPVMDKPLPTSRPAEEEEEEDASDGGEDDEAAPETAGTEAASGRSEFAEKWFWENRGANNRTWKKRKREVTKLKRYEGNKRRTRSSAA